MSGTFTPGVGDIYTSAGNQLAATQTAHLNIDGTLTVTKDANAGSVTPFITSVTINSIAFNQHVSVTFGGVTEDAIATTYGATVATGFGTFGITGVLLATDGTHALLGASNLPAGGLIVSTDAQIFGDGLSDTFTAAFTAACFAEGTRIATPDGAVAVESLRPGQAVISAFGGVVPVLWVGHRRVDCRRHKRPGDVWPVRVAAGAFGEGLPARDLYLSPDHAVHLDGDAKGGAPGVLIPVRTLIDGELVVQVPRDVVTYWHIELPSHDVVLAEEQPAESYLDTGNRSAFANGGTVVERDPDFAQRVWEAEACAAQITHGPIHDAVVARLRARRQAMQQTAADRIAS